MQDNPNLAAAALELGSAAFVLKQSAGSELLKAIDQVMHGKCYVTPKLRPEDWVVQKTRARQYSKQLTSRQRDIVQMCAEGLPIKQIAGHLNLSEKTVEFHKHHIMESLQPEEQCRPCALRAQGGSHLSGSQFFVGKALLLMRDVRRVGFT